MSVGRGERRMKGDGRGGLTAVSLPCTFLSLLSLLLSPPFISPGIFM